jgi:tRNA pseudouridine13 synthase
VTTADLPLLTPDLPGTGGWMVEISDFQVEEIPSYTPCGAGEHCMALIEKRDLTTQEAIRRLCDALGLDAGAAGYAGLKDRHGVTRQWVSLHRGEPARALGVRIPGLTVLEAGLHHNKLRTGHLRGNRFRVLLRGVRPDADALARPILERLAGEGLPNFFGEQRFGRRGDNADRGLELLRGRLKVRDRFQRRLLVSALQSRLFNGVLAARLGAGTHRRLLGGEVLQKVESGGMFVSEEPVVDARRLAAGEVVITGPICGPRMVLPAPGSPALALEERVLEEGGVSPADFAALGRLARGGRRPLTVPVLGATVESADEGLWLGFALPPGAYATVLLREVTKKPWT